MIYSQIEMHVWHIFLLWMWASVGCREIRRTQFSCDQKHKILSDSLFSENRKDIHGISCKQEIIFPLDLQTILSNIIIPVYEFLHTVMDLWTSKINIYMYWYTDNANMYCFLHHTYNNFVELIFCPTTISKLYRNCVVSYEHWWSQLVYFSTFAQDWNITQCLAWEF